MTNGTSAAEASVNRSARNAITGNTLVTSLTMKNVAPHTAAIPSSERSASKRPCRSGRAVDVLEVKFSIREVRFPGVAKGGNCSTLILPDKGALHERDTFLYN